MKNLLSYGIDELDILKIKSVIDILLSSQYEDINVLNKILIE